MSAEPPLVCFPLRIDAELAGVIPAGEAERPFPAPEWSSRDPGRSGAAALAGAPGPVAKLAQSASAALWTVRVQWSKGSMPHAVTGRPGPPKEAFAVRGWKVVDGDEGSVRRNFAAVYRGAAWDAVWLWGPGIGWFGLAGRTDLDAYLVDPMWPAEWFDAIRAWRAEQERAAKARAAARPKPVRSQDGL
jgi:hypothetical protein